VHARLNNPVHNRFTPALLLFAVIVAVSTVLRIALAARPDVAVNGGLSDWLHIGGLGLLYDLVTASYLVAPLVLWLAVLPQRLARSGLARVLVFVVFVAGTYACLVLALSEWLFWDEFGTRFNFIAVDYLLYTHEVLGNIWESYPVGKLLLALLVPAATVAWLLKRPLWRSAGAPAPWPGRIGFVAFYALCVAGTLHYLDTDLRSFSKDDAPNDLAANGVYEFFAANRRNELSYERYYAAIPLPEAMARVRSALGVHAGFRLASGDDQGVERHVQASEPERRLNVVLVSVESLGAEFLGSYGNPKGLTPSLDRLASQSLWFSRVYATGNRTVRGMEALSLALPPTPGQSIVRRPKNENLFSLGSVFDDKGYSVIFAYGGYGYFDNMTAFFGANDYRPIDRQSIPASRIEFENIWGVADEHLFDQVLEEIDREKRARPERPVFAHVMTTSNHRPYTYPPNRIDIPSGTGRDGAVKYSDYAIGRFIEAARRKPWFDDTVFVLTADHGASARGTMQIPLDKYLIPVLVYSPKHVQPRRVERLMSQIDIAPTILGLLNVSYYTKFFGRDVLNSEPGSDRVFVANYQTLGYLQGDRLVVLQPKRKIDSYRLTERGMVSLSATDPSMARDAIAFYEAASFVFRNGLYGDEEQLPPQQRASLRAARPGS
jgi:phosphoglycerol transferase MdoB-like AlkP superfamily enzyme